jgi:uncharacterized membrane protein YcaP (DUF421 family)
MDIVLRAGIAFLFVFFLTRVIGRRELGSMEPFDLILLIVLGDLVQQGITQSDYSVTGLFLAVSTMALLTVFFSYLSFKFPRLRPVLDGEPIVIVRDGEPIWSNLKRERLTVEEVMAEARRQQIASLDDIKWAVLETSGQISFISSK